MTSSRETFLARVRSAVAEGNRAGGSPALPDRGSVGYQGAGPDPVLRLRDEFVAAGGHFHLVSDAQQAVAAVLQIVQRRSARRVLVGDGAVLDALPLAEALSAAGVVVERLSTLEEAAQHDTFFAADVGVSGADRLIAETGTVVLQTRRDQPRSLSLLPPVHVVVARAGQILPDLFDLFGGPAEQLPACQSLITGPSKTGDIELKLVTGVHGPGELHLVLLG